MQPQELSKDVRIKNGEKRFKFRVAGIIEKDDKLLLVRMNDNPFFCFPGGHVELLENTAHAVERELNEELYFEVKVKELLYVHENFFEDKNGKFHELCFYYKAVPAQKDFKPVDTLHDEIDCGQLIHHEYKWIDKNNLNSVHAEPKLIIKNYLKDSNKFLHLLTDDIKK